MAGVILGEMKRWLKKKLMAGVILGETTKTVLVESPRFPGFLPTFPTLYSSKADLMDSSVCTINPQ